MSHLTFIASQNIVTFTNVTSLVHNVVFECHRVTRAYVGVFDWLVSNAFCDKFDLNYGKC